MKCQNCATATTESLAPGGGRRHEAWSGSPAFRWGRSVSVCYFDQLVEAQRKKGTVHFHRVATQGGDERRVRERRGQRERGL